MFNLYTPSGHISPEWQSVDYPTQVDGDPIPTHQFSQDFSHQQDDLDLQYPIFTLP